MGEEIEFTDHAEEECPPLGVIEGLQVETHGDVSSNAGHIDSLGGWCHHRSYNDGGG